MYNLIRDLLNVSSALLNDARNEIDLNERNEMTPWSWCESKKRACNRRHREKECGCDNPYNIKENRDEYVIEFTDDFDGYKVEIEYEDYVLTLKAKKEEGNKTTTLSYIMTLPDEIVDDPDRIKAENIEGNHIKVTIPKVEKHNSRKIEIQ